MMRIHVPRGRILTVVACCWAVLLLSHSCLGFVTRLSSRHVLRSSRSTKLLARFSPVPPPIPPPPPPMPASSESSSAAVTTAINQLQHQVQDLLQQVSHLRFELPDEFLTSIAIKLETLQLQFASIMAKVSTTDMSTATNVDQQLAPIRLQLATLSETVRQAATASSSGATLSSPDVSALFARLNQLQLDLDTMTTSDSMTRMTTMANLPLMLLQSYKTVDVIVASILGVVLASTVLSMTLQQPRISKVYPLERYDADAARAYFKQRPLLALKRATFIATQSLAFGYGLLQDYLTNSLQDESQEERRGRELAALLTRLGPSFIKVGQSLSIRTDLLRPGYLKGLATLQDQVPAFDTATATAILQEEWKRPLSQVLTAPLAVQPIAAASLGQVYKAELLQGGGTVAIKVQRPEILEQIALDMHLVRQAAPFLKRVLALNSDIVAAVDAWGLGFVDELDYTQEALNAESFMTDIAATPLANVVFAPQAVPEYSTRKVLVTEWIDGERLDQSSQADVTVLCSIAMNTYLTMLLDESFTALHCDPHPGNLLRTPEGRLCILDWGMVTRLDSNLQLTLIEHVAHLVSADYAEIPRDLLLLDFIPKDKAHLIENSGVVEVLAGIYGSWSKGGGAAAVNVNEVVQQLQDLAAKNDGNFFQLPAYFAYIAKSFSVLEGIGLTNNKNYSIIKECLPYISQRLITDKRNLGPALNTFLFGPEKLDPNRIVDYERLEQLFEGFGEFTTASSGALLGKESVRRVEVLERIADQVLDLVVTEESSPIQDIFLEQLAKIIASGSRTVFERVRERSGVLPSGRTVLGTLVDPLGLWRTSPLVRANELDERTVEMSQKLVELVQRQAALRNKGDGMDLTNLSREETTELSSILTRKIWERRAGVFKTGSLLARQLLSLTADKLEAGERDSRQLPVRAQVSAELLGEHEMQTVEDTSSDREKPVSPRLVAARQRIAELQNEEKNMNALTDVYTN